jgi:hypothetical protein
MIHHSNRQKFKEKFISINKKNLKSSTPLYNKNFQKIGIENFYNLKQDNYLK